MNKDIFIPIILFVLSSLLTLIILPATAVSLIVGVLILAATFIRKRHVVSPNRLMLRSGLALVVGPALTFGMVFLGMGGYLGA